MSDTSTLRAVSWQHAVGSKPGKVEFDLSSYNPAVRYLVCEELQLAAYRPIVKRAWLYSGMLFVKINTDGLSGTQREALVTERAGFLSTNVIPVALRKGVQITQGHKRQRTRTRRGQPMLPVQPTRSPAFTG